MPIKLMVRVRPGVELTCASFCPSRELIRLDFPTFDRPKKANSGGPAARAETRPPLPGNRGAAARVRLSAPGPCFLRGGSSSGYGYFREVPAGLCRFLWG